MVGTIIFKNFETGSYKDIVLTAYGGKNYADIGKGDFFSCRVNLEDKSIRYEHMSCENPEFRDMFDIFLVAGKAREFLYRNTHVTIAEFCLAGDECVLRPKSFTCGVCEPVDFRTLFNNGGFYMLVKSYSEKTPMWLSVFCEVINFCVQNSFGISAGVFGYSGYGVYLNISSFKKSMLSGADSRLSERIIKLAGSKDCFILNGAPKVSEPVEYQGVTPKSAGDRIICVFSALKREVSNHFKDSLKNLTDKTEIFGAIKDLAKDSYAEHLCDEFVNSLSDFADFCYEYGYVEGKSHVKMLTLREVMLLNSGIYKKEDVAPLAKARSVNRKYINSQPCAPFIDSDGTAVWINGGY